MSLSSITHSFGFVGQGNMMASRVPILLLFVCCFSKFYIGIGAAKLSEGEDIQLEEQLKPSNKHAVTTILTIYGEKYDCVDFYKQPAFDHPALKNHNFHQEMRPSSYLEGRTYKNSSTNRSKSFWMNRKGCPFGTVPIKQTTKEDLITAKLASKIYAKQYEPLTTQEPGTHYAVVHTNHDIKKKFNGGGMETCIYNPRPVTGFQYSSSQIKIANGQDSIEVGWTVNPTLYKGDDRVRLFIYTNAGTSRCFNTHCPGFIIVRSDVPIDQILSPVSKRGSATYGQRILIYRDSPSGNWWLVLDREQTKVGFWPKRIFTGLTDLATYIEWGGKTYSPPSVPSPPMGAGHALNIDIFWDAFCRLMVTVNETYQTIDAPETLTKFADIKEYQVQDEGFYDPTYRRLAFYGGRGGYIGN